MGTGLIPADGEVWRARRRAIVPALHKKYVASMVGMFSQSALHGCKTLDRVSERRSETCVRHMATSISLCMVAQPSLHVHIPHAYTLHTS